MILRNRDMRCIALFVFLLATMLHGNRLRAQENQKIDFYMLVDRTYYHDTFGSLIVKDGNPEEIELQPLGIYNQFDVYTANVQLWVGDVYYSNPSYSPPYGVVLVESPENVYDPGMSYPLDNDALRIINDPNSKIREEIPVTECTIFSTWNSPTIRFRAWRVYAMAAPWGLKSAAFGKTVCANDELRLESVGWNATVQSNQFVTFTSEWEYQLADGIWHQMNSISNPGYDFNYFTPASFIPELRTAKQTVRFRYRHKAVYATHTYYSPYSPTSDVVEILPSAPTVTNGGIQIIPSCAGESTGSVTIPGSAIRGGFSQMKWLLRTDGATQPCDPAGNGCGALDRWSDGAVPVSNGITISGLATDTFTLWLLNPGADAGSCYTPYTIIVPERTQLTATENTAQHVNASCFNASDGSISITAAGGDEAATYSFTLLRNDAPIQADNEQNGKSIIWKNLPAGTYKTQVTNSTCNAKPAVTGNIIITEPARLTGSLHATHPLCVSPGDGMIAVTATGTASAYQFNLYRNDTLIQQSGVVTANNYTFTELPGGIYKAEIINNDAPLCPKWNDTISLRALTPLKLSVISKDSVSCFGGSDGRIEVAAEGGSGIYTFTLSGNGQNSSNTTGNFNSLPAGDYTITLKNQGTACNDQSVLNVSVYQRPVLNVQLQQTAPGCYPNTTGILKAIVTGGSGAYSYNWQQQKNGVWTSNPFWFSSDTQIDDLSAGTYRVIITDGNASGCTITSAESTVAEVTEVKITSVTVQDAVCLADGAHIVVRATGGNGAYNFEYSLDGNIWQAFTAATALNTAGNYRIRVSDAHGCTVVAPGTYTVTLPTAPLSFSVVLSDYNGYNVSCKGNNNGFAQITATGGNGGSYNGYTYALDNGIYSAVTKIDGITGGTHELHVKDARGCIRTQQINMTEPVATLGLRVTDKEHLGCGAEPIGHITVAADGGSSPYTYAIDNSAWQNGTTFSNITAGDHIIKVKDGGGCTTTITTTLTAAYAPLSATADLTDVKCSGESNGAITLHVSGGDGNYTYQWNTPSLSGSSAVNIPAGDYTISITDSKGCKQELAYTIHQPEKLELKLKASSICEGATDGSIDAIVSGGTSPYRYSLDQSSWLNAGSFTGLSEGKYQIAVQDAHGCGLNGEATISKSNIKPDVNFLVASRRNAFDTLIIKDISLPEPDAISWSYDPAATLLGYENGTPQIKFTNPGTYWVELAATFGACTYTIRKDLQIGAYDPQAGPGYVTPVQVIDTVMVSPNPNNGNFNFRIKLNRRQQIVAYVYDMNGTIAGKKQYAPTLQVDDNFSVPGTVTGTFILRVITESESKDVRFIISR